MSKKKKEAVIDLGQFIDPKEAGKIVLFNACVIAGWLNINPQLKCVYRRDEKNKQVRLNFRDEKELVLEVKNPMTPDEAKVDPNRTNAKWAEVRRAKYSDVSVADDGAVEFPKSNSKPNAAASPATETKEK